MKTILITGASSGIGQASALYFAKQGWNVIAGMRRPHEDRKFSDIDAIHPVRLDVTKQEDIDAVYQYAMEQGGIDVLFSNAGISTKGNLEAIPDPIIHQVFDTDFFGPVQLIKKFIPYFKKKESGTIMATSSISGVTTFPYDSVYSAAKHALNGLLESLYYELYPYHVQVKVLVPGPVNTNLKITTFGSPQNLKPAKKLSKILIPDFSQIIEPEEVAKAAYDAVTDPENKFEYIIGAVAQQLIAERNAKGIEAYKDELADQIYNS